MKHLLRLNVLFPAALVSMLFAVPALAQCGGLSTRTMKPASFSASNGMGAKLMRVALGERSDDELDPIVGMWHVKYISQGSGAVAPDGAVIDAGYTQWHSDGTEILNSGARPPSSSNFCLGVWKKVGPREYRLNHFAIAWDPTGAKFIGPAQFHEDIILASDGRSFKGAFAIDQYSDSGPLLVHLQGIVQATRITINTPVEPVF